MRRLKGVSPYAMSKVKKEETARDLFGCDRSTMRVTEWHRLFLLEDLQETQVDGICLEAIKNDVKIEPEWMLEVIHGLLVDLDLRNAEQKGSCW